MNRAEILGTAKSHITRDREATHGKPENSFGRKWANPSGTRTYYAWRSMRARCYNQKSDAWANYGGRGIAVCDRWRDDYDAFFADMGECPIGMTLDRIDPEAGYAPENCRWAGWDIQARNKRGNVFLEHDGLRLNAVDWADRLGIKRATLFKRLSHYRMDAERALTAGSLIPARSCGTRQGYEKGCRCGECKAAHAARHRAMRAKRKEKSND